jgi:hypothetical protein
MVARHREPLPKYVFVWRKRCRGIGVVLTKSVGDCFLACGVRFARADGHKATSSIGVSRELLTKRLLASCSQNAFLEYRGFERAAHKTTSSMGVSSELLTKRLRVSGFRASCSGFRASCSQNAFLEYRGFDPRASRMQSERSTN